MTRSTMAWWLGLCAATVFNLATDSPPWMSAGTGFLAGMWTVAAFLEWQEARYGKDES